MSALASTINENVNDSIAQISTNARVDYILRFSKQAVIVLDDTIENYSAVGSQFLGNIPNHHNAAYLSVSPKLNDIQIRARIVEQLYFDQAFDPEKSIAVTLINLVKSAPQTLSIVIEHAQLLSLQIVHELCQLAEIAKKSSLEINVLMLGDNQLGQLLYENQSLFQKKVSIVDAQSGQLLAVNAKQFKPKVAFLSWTANKVLIIGFSMLILVAMATLVYLANRDVTEFSGLEVPESPHSTSGEYLVKLGELSPSTENSPIESSSKVAKQADILNALLGESSPTEVIKEVAVVDDIFVALTAADEQDAVLNVGSKQHELLGSSNEVALHTESVPRKGNDSATIHSKKVTESEPLDSPSASMTDSVGDLANQISQYPQGAVVQLGGFRQRSVMASFIAAHQADIQLFHYQRIQSGQPYWVVTSKVYKTRTEAAASIEQLPQILKKRSPWVKSVIDVNKERVVNNSSSE
ncbi:SPOR domain-containing protein [Thalassotalea fusca]